jgi:hypothetical protein
VTSVSKGLRKELSAELVESWWVSILQDSRHPDCEDPIHRLAATAAAWGYRKAITDELSETSTDTSKPSNEL